MRRTDGLQRAGQMIALVIVSAGCTLPRPGPTIQELAAAPDDGTPALQMVEITDEISARTRLDEALNFSFEFETARIENIEVIRPLDVLDIFILETAQPPLYPAAGLGPSRVDLSGYVFIPYVGRMLAGGMTTEQFREHLTREIGFMTPEPQVNVQIGVGGNNTVKVFGDTGAIGEFPITSRTRTLSGLLANAVGGAFEPETARITIRRDDMISSTWLDNVMRDPRADVAMRGGDVLLIERDPRAFLALGALGANSVVEFPEREISLLNAISIVGGLNASTADPRGVFVLRKERPEIVAQVAPDAPEGTERVAYVMDLTKPASFFVAANFGVRDDDIIYVSEAPYVQFLKIVGSIAPPLQAVDSATSVVARAASGFEN